MKPIEFGTKLRTMFPGLKEVDFNDEDLALDVLSRHRSLYRLLSPTAERVKEVSDRIPSSTRWTEIGRIESEAKIIQNQVAEIQMLHLADNVIRASAMGVPVEAVPAMVIETHKTNEIIRLEQSRTAGGLDAGNRELLTLRELIRLLEVELDETIDKLDREKHPEKRRDLNDSIAFQREELRARRQQAMVQITGGERLDVNDEDTDGPRGRGAEVEESVQRPDPSQTAGLGV